MPEIVPPAQVMMLPPALRARVHDEVLAGRPSRTARLDRLLHLVLDAQGLALGYREDATLSVAQAYAQRSANCVSFTLMFVALGREAGLDVFAQEIRKTLSWRQDGDTFYRNDHINAGVRIGSRVYEVDFARNAVIALAAPVPVSDQRLLAHYYNNLAMQQMAQGQLAVAMTHMRTTLLLDPAYAPHWSNAGVLHLRQGDLQAAEHAYAQALALDPRHLSTLQNLTGLWRRRGDRERENEFRLRLERELQRDPLHHFLQAENHERSGDYANAIRHYQSAIRLHQGEHRFHAAIARAYQRSGDRRRAIKALARAHAFSHGAARAAYAAQLAELRQMAK